MDKILVFYCNQPCLDKLTGLNRDRNPDSNWHELRSTILTAAKEVELTPELKQILLEDIAYVYGNDSKKFTAKLKEFNLIITTKVKDTWNREEVINIASKAHTHGYNLCLGTTDDMLEFSDWIENNL